MSHDKTTVFLLLRCQENNFIILFSILLRVSNYSALDHDQGSCYTNVKITFVLINSVKKTENSKIQTIPFEKVLDILDSKNALQTLKHYECKHWQGAFEDKF